MNLIIKGELSIETESGLKINSRLIELLKLVQETGSLNTAVKEMDLSYSHTWNTLYKINCHLNEPLLITQRGGKGGGVAFLTNAGIRLIEQYDNLKDSFHQFLEEHKVDLSS
jgi:molybdate transport repressor ModE-like protein